jgi:hypothetical protein
MSTNNGIASDFDKPEQIKAICETLQTVENVRAKERAMVDILMNGKRPYSDDEVKKFNIRINVNWNEGNNILQDANRQVNNATLYVGRFFTAKCMAGPEEKRDEWGQKFTNYANRVLKKKVLGKKHLFLRKTRNASVCLHGIGPMMWMKDSDLLPRFVALEDLLIPTDTTLDLCNLQHFAINLYLTQGEFYDMTHGDKVDKGWNVQMVEKILNALVDPTKNVTLENAQEQPEKWQEQWKQNRCFYNSDAVPRVRLRMFLFKDRQGKWYRRVVLRENPGTRIEQLPKETVDQFVYTSKTVFADDIAEILHVQFGDCSIVPPLKYHSVRGLGTLLYGPCEMNNRLLCQKMQAAFDTLMQLLRIENPNDQIRQAIVQLFNYAVVEKGVGFVKGDERHTPDVALVDSAISSARQNMSQNSASFVQDINDGTDKEMTLGEAEIRANAANVMVGGMLQSMYGQEEYYFEELVRRLCMLNPTDPDIIKFQKDCARGGIPQKAYQNADYWEVTVERVIGAGDQTLAQQRTSALLGQSQRFDPQSQRKILHKWTAVITDNPDTANDLVPLKEPEATEGSLEADNKFGTLMQGVEVDLVEGIDQQGYIESMIMKMGAKIGKLEEQEAQGIPLELDELQGLDMVQQDIVKHVELLAQNPEHKQLVKEYMDALGQLTNMLKKFIQHFSEQMQAQQEASQIDPEAQAKASSTMMLAEVNKNIKEQQAMQKLQQSQMKFQQKMEQSAEQHIQRITQDAQKQMAEMQKQLVQLQADLAEQAARTQADIKATEAKAKAAPEAEKVAAE